MALFALEVVAWLLLMLIFNTGVVNEQLDEETRERMRQREEMLNREMTRLWKEIEQRDQELRDQELRNQEQRDQEQSISSWASLLLAALQHWQFWAVAGGLVLLFGLCWWQTLTVVMRTMKHTAQGSG